MNLFTMLITDKCVNTCFHHWAATIQFDSNLFFIFGFSHNFVLIAPCLWLVAICNLQSINDLDFTLLFASLFCFFPGSITF